MSVGSGRWLLTLSMLAPFAPHPITDTTARGNYAELAAPCLLKGTNEAIQTPKNPVNAHVRPDDDDGLIREGSHVILYTTRDSIDSIIVKKGATLDNKHGRFAHSDLIGRPYGSRVCLPLPCLLLLYCLF